MDTVRYIFVGGPNKQRCLFDKIQIACIHITAYEICGFSPPTAMSTHGQRNVLYHYTDITVLYIILVVRKQRHKRNETKKCSLRNINGT